MLSKVCYLIFRHFVYFKATNTEILVKISIFQKKQLFLIIIYLLKKLLTLSLWNASFSRKNKLFTLENASNLTNEILYLVNFIC